MNLTDNELKALNRELRIYAMSLLRDFKSEFAFEEKDLASQVVLEFQANPKIFDPGKAPLAAFLKVVLKNQLLNKLKKHHVRKRFESNFSGEESQTNLADSQIDYDALLNLIRKKLATDPVGLDLFNEIEQWGYKKQDICQKLGLDNNAFYGALRRVRTVVCKLMPSKRKEYGRKA